MKAVLSDMYISLFSCTILIFPKSLLRPAGLPVPSSLFLDSTLPMLGSILTMALKRATNAASISSMPARESSGATRSASRSLAVMAQVSSKDSSSFISNFWFAAWTWRPCPCASM